MDLHAGICDRTCYVSLLNIFALNLLFLLEIRYYEEENIVIYIINDSNRNEH